MFVSLLAQAADNSNSLGQMLLLFGAPILILYFFILGPQKKKDQERALMLGKIRKHDRILTSGGIWGTVVSVKDEELIVRIDEDNNVRVRLVKSAVLKIESSSRDGQQEQGAEAGSSSEKK